MASALRERVTGTFTRDTRAYGDRKMDHGDLDADSGHLAESGYLVENKSCRLLEDNVEK